jgi:hypothetical protein
MADLITSARALYNLNNMSLTANESTTLAALITAVSKAIEQYTGRVFASTQHDELYNGLGQRRLVLRHIPVISVARVAGNPISVLEVSNTSGSNQRATVSVTSTGMSLVRVASGTTTTSTLTFAANTTIGALKTAIDALGNGWSATLPDADYTSWASADLRAVQGALNAKDVTAALKLHTEELTAYEVDIDKGFLLRSDQGTLLAADGPCWSGGPNYWRVVYTAGYATVPENVQEACAQWVAALFWQTKRDPGLRQEQMPSVISRAPYGGMPEGVRQLLLLCRTSRLIHLGG